MSAAFTEVFRSERQRECEERAFMLSAVGIANAVHVDGGQFAVVVEQADAVRAGLHIARYEVERRPPSAPPRPTMPHHSHAWVGCVFYAALLVVIGLLVANGIGREDAFSAGELLASAVQSGQWWRAGTALTLHLDGAHLSANLVGGIWFGYLAARQLGSGNAWLLIVAGAACANWLEGWFGPPSHLSVGASTAVFTALGLLSAHSWRYHYSRVQRWALRWAPLVAGVVLLGWFGSGDANTDIVAHALGFAIGAALGALATRHWAERALARLPQWLGGTAAIAMIVVAWWFALRS